MTADTGIVSTQAQTMVPAMFQRTAESRLLAPTPAMAPVMVCVVLTGTPNADASRIVAPPPVSAQKPPKGVSFVMRVPIVYTMRQPPRAVPAAIAEWAASTTHIGT